LDVLSQVLPSLTFLEPITEQVFNPYTPSPRYIITMPQFVSSSNLHSLKRPLVSRNRDQVRSTDSYLASSSTSSTSSRCMSSEFITSCKRRCHNERDTSYHKWAPKQTSAQPASHILPTVTESSDDSWGFFVEFEVDDNYRSSLDYEGITKSSDFGFK
jgi:hypothetical protein